MLLIKVGFTLFFLLISTQTYAVNICGDSFGVKNNVPNVKNEKLEQQAVDHWARLSRSKQLLISEVYIGSIETIKIYLAIFYDPSKQGLIFKTIAKDYDLYGHYISVTNNIVWGPNAIYKYSNDTKVFTLELKNFPIPYSIRNASIEQIVSSSEGNLLKSLQEHGFKLKEFDLNTEEKATMFYLMPEELTITGKIVAATNQFDLYSPGSTSMGITSKFKGSSAIDSILHQQPNEKLQEASVRQRPLERVNHGVVHYFKSKAAISIIAYNPYPTAIKKGPQPIPPELKKDDITRPFFQDIFSKPAISAESELLVEQINLANVHLLILKDSK